MEWGLGNISIIVFYIKVFEGPIANPPGAGFWEASVQDALSILNFLSFLVEVFNYKFYC